MSETVENKSQVVSLVTKSGVITPPVIVPDHEYKSSAYVELSDATFRYMLWMISKAFLFLVYTNSIFSASNVSFLYKKDFKNQAPDTIQMTEVWY